MSQIFLEIRAGDAPCKMGILDYRHISDASELSSTVIINFLDWNLSKKS